MKSDWRRQWWLLCAVVGGHSVLIAFLLLSGCAAQPTPPTVQTMKARLVALPTPAPPAPRAPDRAPDREPERQPAPPPQKTAVRKVPAPVKEAPPKKKPKKEWRSRTPEEIRRDAQLADRPRPRPAAPTESAASIAARLSERVPVRKVSIPAPSSREVRTDAMRQYYAAVSARLYSLWAQPDRSAIGSGLPSVQVSIRVTRDGRVAKTTMLAKSAMPAMDDSVALALSRLGRLPAFSDYGVEARELEIPIVFQVN